jgi:hypothetical protein
MHSTANEHDSEKATSMQISQRKRVGSAPLSDVTETQASVFKLFSWIKFLCACKSMASIEDRPKKGVEAIYR